jgi:hypothetical protein
MIILQIVDPNPEEAPRLVASNIARNDVRRTIRWLQTELEDLSFSTTRISTHLPGKRRFASRIASLLASVWFDAST